MAAQSKEVYAKMAPSLDRNRKIRRGGRDAREVYLWVLRRVAERGVTNWRIPAEDVQDADYLADELMCSPEEARNGLERAILVRLLAIDGADCVVCGGEDEWARKAMTGAERTAKWKKSLSGDEAPVSSPSPGDARVTATSSPVTAENAGDVGEERRGEERKDSAVTGTVTPLALISDPEPAKRQTGAPERGAPGLALASACCETLNRLTGSSYEATTKLTLRLAGRLEKQRVTADEVRAVTEDRVSRWQHDAKMAEYLRPKTLLAEEKFMSYRDDLRSRPARSLRLLPSTGPAMTEEIVLQRSGPLIMILDGKKYRADGDSYVPLEGEPDDERDDSDDEEQAS